MCEVPRGYRYRRGSVSHSWREASLEPILAHTSEYDTLPASLDHGHDDLSSEYDAETEDARGSNSRGAEVRGYKAVRATVSEELAGSYRSGTPPMLPRAKITTTPPSSPGPPRRIHTPAEELVPERTTRGQAHAAVAAAYGEKYMGGGGAYGGGDYVDGADNNNYGVRNRSSTSEISSTSNTETWNSRREIIEDDLIQEELVQRSFASAPPKKKPPPTLPKPRKSHKGGVNGTNGTHGTASDEINGTARGEITTHQHDHQISYHSKQPCNDNLKF